MQQVLEHSKPVQGLLLSAWACGVDMCAYPIPPAPGGKENAFIFRARPKNYCPDRRCAFHLGIFLKPASSVTEGVSPQSGCT